MTKMANDNSESEKKEDKDKKAKPEEEKPSGKSQPVEGKITADEKSGYIATLAAYKAIIQQAGIIANEIEKQNLGNRPHILIVDSLDFCSLDVQLIQIKQQVRYWDGAIQGQTDEIEEFIKNIAKIITPGKGVGLIGVTEAADAVSGIVSSIADLIGYFRIDYDIKGQAINLANTALQALVAGRLRKKNFSVYLPAFHRLELDKKLKVIEDLNNCITSKNKLKLEIEKLRGYLVSTPIENIKKDEKSSDNKKQITEAEMACKKAEAIIKEFAEFNKALTSVPQGGGLSPIASAAIRQYLDKIGITHLLYVDVTSGGGEMVIGKGLFQWGRIGYLGGCVITYVLAECSGKIIAANTLIGYSKVMYKLCSNKLSEFELG
jgi:hypothetical protein